MKLASEIGANPNKYMGTKTNINFLGTGDKAMKGTTFGGKLNDDFLNLGVSQDDLIKVVEQDMGYVTSGKLNDSQLKVMTDNLTMARDALNPVPPTNLFDIATGTGNLNKKGLESLRGTNIDNAPTSLTDKISEGITGLKAARKAEGDFNKMGAFDSGDSFAAEGARRAVLRQALLKDENALKSLPDGVVDSLKNSKDLMGKANSGNDPLILFRAIYGDAVDFNKIDDIIASEPFSDANTIADKVLAFLKQGDNFADGGRIGYRSGGIFKGLKGIQFGRIQKDLTKKYKDEGMEFMEALQKGNDEGLEIINEKKLNFLNGRMNEVNIYSDDYVKLIDEHIRIVEPDFYKDIKRWEGTRPDLADKTRASFFPDWAEARYGENYMGVLQKKQAKAINESIDPNFKEPLSSADQMVSDIDDMNKANIDDLFGIRKKNADGGRIGFRSGGTFKGISKGIAELLKLGRGQLKLADDIERPDSALSRDLFKAFNDRYKNKLDIDEDIAIRAKELKMDKNQKDLDYVENLYKVHRKDEAGVGTLKEYHADFEEATGLKVPMENLRTAWRSKREYPFTTPIVDFKGKSIGAQATQKMYPKSPKFIVQDAETLTKNINDMKAGKIPRSPTGERIGLDVEEIPAGFKLSRSKLSEKFPELGEDMLDEIMDLDNDMLARTIKMLENRRLDPVAYDKLLLEKGDTLEFQAAFDKITRRKNNAKGGLARILEM